MAEIINQLRRQQVYSAHTWCVCADIGCPNHLTRVAGCRVQKAETVSMWTVSWTVRYILGNIRQTHKTSRILTF